MPLWGERLPKGQGFVVHVRAPLQLEAGISLEDAVLRINQSMEAVILECPEQYLWGYGRYKTPRPG